MLQGEHSAILLTFIKLPFVIKIIVLSIFESGRFTQVLLYLQHITASLLFLSENIPFDMQMFFLCILYKPAPYNLNY